MGKRNNQVRIIGGNWRSRKVAFAANPALRPTPDRVRETLFNWLQGALAGRRTLEPYGGSGVLSLEALSRGAAHATLVERHPATARHLQAEFARFAEASRYAIVQGEALDYLAASQARYGLVFLDPPYDAGGAGGAGELPRALPAAARLLAPGGLVYAESGQALEALAPASLRLHRQGKAGGVHFALMQRA